MKLIYVMLFFTNFSFLIHSCKNPKSANITPSPQVSINNSKARKTPETVFVNFENYKNQKGSSFQLFDSKKQPFELLKNLKGIEISFDLDSSVNNKLANNGLKIVLDLVEKNQEEGINSLFIPSDYSEPISLPTSIASEFIFIDLNLKIRRIINYSFVDEGCFGFVLDESNLLFILIHQFLELDEFIKDMDPSVSLTAAGKLCLDQNHRIITITNESVLQNSKSSNETMLAFLAKTRSLKKNLNLDYDSDLNPLWAIPGAFAAGVVVYFMWRSKRTSAEKEPLTKNSVGSDELLPAVPPRPISHSISRAIEPYEPETLLLYKDSGFKGPDGSTYILQESKGKLIGKGSFGEVFEYKVTKRDSAGQTSNTTLAIKKSSDRSDISESNPSFQKEFEFSRLFFGDTDFIQVVGLFKRDNAEVSEDNPLYLISEIAGNSNLKKYTGDIDYQRLQKFTLNVQKKMIDRGILHGDIKGENVIVKTDGGFQIIDFGEAIQRKQGTFNTQEYSESFFYAPERMKSESDQKLKMYDQNLADAYSSGILLAEAHPRIKAEIAANEKWFTDRFGNSTDERANILSLNEKHLATIEGALKRQGLTPQESNELKVIKDLIAPDPTKRLYYHANLRAWIKQEAGGIRVFNPETSAYSTELYQVVLTGTPGVLAIRADGQGIADIYSRSTVPAPPAKGKKKKATN